MNKNRKGQKNYREMAKDAGVSVGTIAKAMKVHELGRSEEVISGEKTPDEILREEGLLAEKKKTTYLSRSIAALPKLTDDELDTLASAVVAEMEKRGTL